MFKRKDLISLRQDRLMLALLMALLLCIGAIVVTTLLSIRQSDVQIPMRYSGYGFTNIYRDKWYGLWSFALFGLIVGATNGYLAVNLHASRRGLAIGFIALSLFIVVMALIVANAVFHLAAFSL